MPVVDTSWLYALFDDRDEHHPAAVQGADGRGAYKIPSEILAEVLALRWSRARQEKAAAVRDLMKQVQAMGFVVVGTADPAPAKRLFDKHRSLSYPDCIAIAAARSDVLLTFDKRQAKVWRQSATA